MVDFCNARFVEADCIIARCAGVKLGTVFSEPERASGGTQSAISAQRDSLIDGTGSESEATRIRLRSESEAITQRDHSIDLSRS